VAARHVIDAEFESNQRWRRDGFGCGIGMLLARAHGWSFLLSTGEKEAAAFHSGKVKRLFSFFGQLEKTIAKACNCA
jgi:hypothetical protein